MLRGSRRGWIVVVALAVLAVGLTAPLWWPSTEANKTTLPIPVTPAGWDKHVYGAVSFAIPADWRVESYGYLCGGQPAKTVSAFTVNDEGLSAPPTAAVAMDTTSCPNMRNGAAIIRSDETILIQCVLAPRVIIGTEEVHTGGHSLRTMASRGGYYFVGKGFVEEVRAGPGPVARQILTTIALPGGRC